MTGNKDELLIIKTPFTGFKVYLKGEQIFPKIKKVNYIEPPFESIENSELVKKIRGQIK